MKQASRAINGLNLSTLEIVEDSAIKTDSNSFPANTVKSDKPPDLVISAQKKHF